MNLDKIVRATRTKALEDARAAVRAEFNGKAVPEGLDAIMRASRAITRLIVAEEDKS